MDDSLALLTTAYGDLSGVLGRSSPDEAWEPTGCAGWSIVDLGFHLLSDARRALVALNTPAEGPGRHRRRRLLAGVAAAGAGRRGRAVEHPHRGQRPRRAARHLRPVRRDVGGGAGGGVTRAAGDLVRTQGRVLTVADFLSTLTVEAAVHHLDLVLRLDRPGPAAGPLGEVRRVLEGLLGGPLPVAWDDATAARRGTGREPLTDDDRAELGTGAAAFPLFG